LVVIEAIADIGMRWSRKVRLRLTHNVISLPSIDALRKISLDHLLGGGQKARQEGPAGQKAAFNLAAGRINSVRR
jgi:hypothetical protein